MMNSAELHAWDYANSRPVRISWRAGRVVRLDAVPEDPPENIWLAPALVDLQINGYAGVDFQQDGVGEEDLVRSVHALRRDGCAKFLLTLITDDAPRMLERLRHYETLRHRHPDLRQAVMGYHVEGPFLSPKPGFCGAHDPARMQNPTLDFLTSLKAVVGETPVLLTVAPELPGAIEFIRQAVDSGWRVNLGHTDASASQVTAGIGAGARAFTHLGNGCPQLLDRHDNILWRALEADPEMGISLIPDGHHVSPALFRLIHLLRGDNIHYTTDAMSAAGAGPGTFRLGPLTLEVRADGVVRFPGGTNFAGSSLTPIAGVFKAAEMLRRPWQQVWDFFSLRSAQRMGSENSLQAGSPAEFCLLQFPPGGDQSLANLTLKTIVPATT